MPTLTKSGLKVSSSHTPQATDDYYITYDNVVSSFNVLANDLGGNGLSLFSVDQTYSLTPELASVSLLGASISIVNGQIVYDPTHSLALDSLAVGALLQDSFTYWDRLGNGTLSSATVHVTVNGTATPQHGVVEDGYISGATVYIDANGNGAFDAAIDPSAATDANGNFSLTTTVQGPLIAFGGTNIDTGLANTLTFTAPEGSTVINPLTTFMETLMADGMSAAVAQSTVQSALGLGAINVQTYDPLAAGTVDALSTQKTIAQLDTILSAGVAAGATEGAILSTLASSASSGFIQLTDFSTLVALYSAAGIQNAPSLQSLANSVATENTIIGDATTFAAISTTQKNGGAPANAIEMGLGNHYLDATGNETIYLSSGTDVLHFNDGGNYVVWGLNSQTIMDLGDTIGGFSNALIGMNTFVGRFLAGAFGDGTIASEGGVEADGTPYVLLNFNGSVGVGGLVATTMKFEGITTDQFRQYLVSGNPQVSDFILPSQYSAKLSESITLDSTQPNSLAQPGPGDDQVQVHGMNQTVDLSAGGADQVVLYTDEPTNVSIWGFDPLTGDQITINGPADFNTFWNSDVLAGHQGQDSSGHSYYEFNVDNAQIYLMGVTAAQVQTTFDEPSFWGF